MKKTILTVALAGLLGLGVAGASLGQLPTAYKAPKGPGGHPDLNGVWRVGNGAMWDIEPHAAKPAIQMRDGPVVPVPAKSVVALGAFGAVPAGMGVVLGPNGEPGGTLPYKPEMLRVRNDNQAKNITVTEAGTPTEHFLARDPEINCYLPGIPRANYMQHMPFQIFQSDNQMLMAYEYAGAVRSIFMTPQGDPAIDSWMGQSVGKWEGDTLVVTVKGQVDRSWFDRAGNFHGPDMTVTERWTPISPFHIRYEATVDDPNTFTRPWKMSMILYKQVGEDNRLQQFKCVEFVTELLYGHLRAHPLQ